MFAGASWTWWLGFHAAVVALLAADSLLPGRRHETKHAQSVAWMWTGALVVAAALFALWMNAVQGRQRALEFVAGYTIETSLSIDNLFVFLVLFRGFRISEKRQHTALLWGVGGAVVLRGIFIATGVTLLDRFGWITWIFGLLLLYAAWRLLSGGSAHAVIPDWIRRLQPAKGSLLSTPFRRSWRSRTIRSWSIPRTLPRFSAYAHSTSRSPRCSTDSAICTTGSERCLPLSRSRCSPRPGSRCPSRFASSSSGRFSPSAPLSHGSPPAEIRIIL